METDIGSVAVAAATDLSPFALFMQADIVVKAVMLGLLLASIWSWAIIIERARRLKRLNAETLAFEERFWAAENLDGLFETAQRQKSPMARIFTAGFAEWRRSTARGVPEKEALRARLSAIMDVTIHREMDVLADRLNILATVGSVAPFVGLFGTVWGIMRSFTSIAATQNTTLAVVAPGIAEALFATAIGLFAAIPAVIGYNRLLHGLGRLESRLSGFAGEFHGLLSHRLDSMEGR